MSLKGNHQETNAKVSVVGRTQSRRKIFNCFSFSFFFLEWPIVINVTNCLTRSNILFKINSIMDYNGTHFVLNYVTEKVCKFNQLLLSIFPA